MKRDLQIVLKVSERCNINCSYCYYFNTGNDAPLSRPAFVKPRVAQDIVEFVRKTSESMDIGRIRIVLHGGEPLTLKPSKFREVCNILRQIKAFNESTTLVTITNGMRINDQWISVFEDLDIAVCVSLDGPAEYHDMERVDFKGQGTYSRVIEGLKLLQTAAEMGRIVQPSVLSVIDPRFRGSVVYNHIVRELGVRVVDFRVPMKTHDDGVQTEDVDGVGRFLREAFAEWVKDDDPRIRVRLFQTHMSRLLGYVHAQDANPSHIIVGIGSDGTMINDDLMQILGAEIFDRKLNVSRTTMAEYLAEMSKGEVAKVSEISKECLECRWYKVCRPTTLPWDGAEMRYKRSTGFSNKLVFCHAYQEMFSAMEKYVEDPIRTAARSFAG